MNQYSILWQQAVSGPSGILGYMRSTGRNVLLSSLALTRRSMDEKFLRCLYCHYVFDDQRQDFERILLALKQYGTFIDTATCLNMVEGKQPIDGSYFHLSFDDGFKNIATNAAPTLKKHGIPALFFVPTAFVGAPYEQVADYCVRIAQYKNPIEMVSWDDLKRLQDQGIEIGSHTRTHARFSDISQNQERLMEEFAGSKADIERHLGVPCPTISWPYGRLADADDRSIRATRDAGYRACFGAFRGTVIPQQTDIFRIPRHHFEVQWPVEHVLFFARGNMEGQKNV